VNSRAATGKLLLSASPGTKGLHPVISTVRGMFGSARLTVPKGKRARKVAESNRGRP